MRYFLEVTGRAGVKIDANGSNTYNIPLLNANLSNGNLNWVKMYGDTAKNTYNQTVIPAADGGFTMHLENIMGVRRLRLIFIKMIYP